MFHTLTRSQPPGWTGYARRIDVELLGEVAWPAAEEPRVFVCGSTRFVDIAPDEWRRVVEVNLTGAFLVTRAAVGPMRERGWGRIVHFSSTAGKTVSTLGGAHYTASKHGVLGLVRAAARELASFGITVNAVCPGLIDTEMVRARTTREQRDAYARGFPVARLGTPEEVAEIVAFCTYQYGGVRNMASWNAEDYKKGTMPVYDDLPVRLAYYGHPRPDGATAVHQYNQVSAAEIFARAERTGGPPRPWLDLLAPHLSVLQNWTNYYWATVEEGILPSRLNYLVRTRMAQMIEAPDWASPDSPALFASGIGPAERRALARLGRRAHRLGHSLSRRAPSLPRGLRAALRGADPRAPRWQHDARGDGFRDQRTLFPYGEDEDG